MKTFKIFSIISIFFFISCKQNEEKKSTSELNMNVENSKPENTNIEPKSEGNNLIENFKEFRKKKKKKRID